MKPKKLVDVLAYEIIELKTGLELEELINKDLFLEIGLIKQGHVKEVY